MATEQELLENGKMKHKFALWCPKTKFSAQLSVGVRRPPPPLEVAPVPPLLSADPEPLILKAPTSPSGPEVSLCAIQMMISIFPSD